MFRSKAKDGTTRLEGVSLTLATAINLFHPVGSLIMTTDNVNPETRFPNTTWVQWGQGRSVVGVGSNGTNSYTSEQTFGADSVTLTGAQSGVNAHDHRIYANVGFVSADHGHNFQVQSETNTPTGGSSRKLTDVQNVVGGFGSEYYPTTNGINANHLHLFDGWTWGQQTANAPAVTSHENRQASIATYLWKRTV